MALGFESRRSLLRNAMSAMRTKRAFAAGAANGRFLKEVLLINPNSNTLFPQL